MEGSIFFKSSGEWISEMSDMKRLLSQARKFYKDLFLAIVQMPCNRKERFRPFAKRFQGKFCFL